MFKTNLDVELTLRQGEQIQFQESVLLHSKNEHKTKSFSSLCKLDRTNSLSIGKLAWYSVVSAMAARMMYLQENSVFVTEHFSHLESSS